MIGALRKVGILAVIGLLLAFSSPSMAQAASAIPEPTNLALLAMGVIGLLVGRHAARRRRDD